MRIGAAIAAILVLGSTADVAWSDPITVAISPSSGTLAVGDTVTVTVTFDGSQLSYPAAADQLRYFVGIHFDSLIFAFTSQSGVPDAGDSVFFELLDQPNHDATSFFQYTDKSPFASEFTFSETFTAIRGTRGPGYPSSQILVIAPAAYRLGGELVTIDLAEGSEFYDVTPYVPEPGVLALSSVVLAAYGARWSRKRRKQSMTAGAASRSD